MDNIEKIKCILKHAYNNVEYYENIFDKNNIDINNINNYEDFCKIPLLEKETIQENIDMFIDRNLNKEELKFNTTSGSTGRVLTIYWDKFDHLKAVKNLWRVRKTYGITPKSKKCQFHPFVLKGNQPKSPKIVLLDKYKLSFSLLDLNTDNFLYYFEKMIDYEPDWISAPPSALYLFSRFIEKNNLRIPNCIKYIELSGELLTDSYREKINSVFKNAKIVNQYGCRETGAIAIECINKNLHILSNNVFVEILKDGNPVEDGESGDIYVTSLTNKSMPIIRYKLGDRGVIYNKRCEACNCCEFEKTLELIAGRTSELVLFRNKESQSTTIFWYAIQRLNFKMNNLIQQFRIIQLDYEEFKIIFSIREKSLSDENTLISEFKNILMDKGFPNVNWEFEFRDNIDIDTKTGKLRYFESKIY